LALPYTKNRALGVNVLRQSKTSNTMQQPECASYQSRLPMSASNHGKTVGASVCVDRRDVLWGWLNQKALHFNIYVKRIWILLVWHSI
jgi:hypothetical protein